MPIEIPTQIKNTEILVRYLFDRDFKKKKIIEERLQLGNIFMPYKGGVSLQRALFCNENQCKERAKNIPNNYVGFVIFRKSTFEATKRHYIQNNRSEFDATIIASPMKDENTYYPEGIKIFQDMLGNPAHADLKYINPAPIDDETPKTAIRSFSRKFMKNCHVIIDENPQNKDYEGSKFDTII